MPLSDTFARWLRVTPGWCCVCGKPTAFFPWDANLRESGACVRCGVSNRRRQLAHVLLRAIAPELSSLRRLAGRGGLTLYNCETEGGTHSVLAAMPGYVCSEYFGPEHAPGALVGGRRHEDLTQLSFASGSFDVVLTSDVLEHVPEPYAAHREIHRVLRPGGRHLFTVPYIPAFADDEQRARIRNGAVEHLLPPIHHVDPLRPQGILVFTHFGRAMLARLAEIGFATTVHRVRSLRLGLLGDDGYVFEARKAVERHEPPEQADLRTFDG